MGRERHRIEPPNFGTEFLTGKMLRRVLPATLLLAVAACTAQPMRWEKAGADAARDETECRAAAHQEAILRLPYGNGPPLYGFHGNQMSMLDWKLGIDNERSHLEEDLTKACMHHKGFELVPIHQAP